jgi:hypothetical protein
VSSFSGIWFSEGHQHGELWVSNASFEKTLPAQIKTLHLDMLNTRKNFTLLEPAAF